MATAKSFKGTNVFMSRNLVPPELFDTLHDALKQNEAEVLLCCDPSRTGPNDYHIISSLEHEKFNDLRSKGCNLLGSECVFSCAKEHRILPKQGFTCCLAMDGVKVLASGFDMDEKVKIEKLVTAMGGAFQTKIQDCSNIDQDHSQEHSSFGISNHWSPSIERKDDKTNAGEGTKSIYDTFSETQTEDQVVGYEEDLSGRQMIIDRVRKRSSMT